MNELVSKHYDETYFNYQKAAGEFGGWANSSLFSRYIKPEDTVLDFGCSGGWLLMNLHCRRKIGVEVNPSAAEVALKNGIEVYQSVQYVPDSVADVIISNHALEHTLHPLRELKSLRPKLHQSGRIVFIVPCESIRNSFKLNDMNHHLYTWSPMCLANLFTEAGYLVEESKLLMHKWRIQFHIIKRLGGRRLFDFICWLYAHIERSSFQVRIVAHV